MDATLHLLRTVGEQRRDHRHGRPPLTAAAPCCLHPAPVPRRQVAPAPVLAPPGPGRASGGAVQAPTSVVRVRTQLLDRLVNEAGEVMITRSRLDARVGQLRSFVGRPVRQPGAPALPAARHGSAGRIADAVAPSSCPKTAAADFDPLEFDRFTRVQELTRMMAESVNDVATVQRNLQRAWQVRKTTCSPRAARRASCSATCCAPAWWNLTAIAERLYAVVRQAAKDTGKQVKLDIARRHH